MKTLVAVLFGIMFIVAQAFAGHEAGGGGALVCSNGHSIVTLDLYEAREVYKLVVDYGPEKLNAMEHVRYVLARFAKFDSGRAARYLRDAEEFMKIAVFKPGITLGDITDSMHVYIPDNCRVIQVVSQSQNSFPPRPTYLVVENLWNQLDETGKAAMILHEVFYKEGIENGHEHSLRSRYFHELVAANEISTLGRTDKEYLGLLRADLGFKFFYKQGMQFPNDEKKLSFYSDGSLESAEKTRVDQVIQYGDNKIQVMGHSKNSWPDMNIILFYQGTGDLKAVNVSTPPDPFKMGFKVIDFRFNSGGYIGFAPSKGINSLTMNGTMDLKVQGRKIRVAPYLKFDASENVFSFVASAKARLKTVGGDFVTIEWPNMVRINDQDLVVDVD